MFFYLDLIGLNGMFLNLKGFNGMLLGFKRI